MIYSISRALCAAANRPRAALPRRPRHPHRSFTSSHDHRFSTDMAAHAVDDVADAVQQWHRRQRETDQDTVHDECSRSLTMLYLRRRSGAASKAEYVAEALEKRRRWRRPAGCLECPRECCPAKHLSRFSNSTTMFEYQRCPDHFGGRLRRTPTQMLPCNFQPSITVYISRLSNTSRRGGCCRHVCGTQVAQCNQVCSKADSLQVSLSPISAMLHGRAAAAAAGG